MVFSISMARARIYVRGVFFKVILKSSSYISLLSFDSYLCEIPDPSMFMLWKGRSDSFHVLHLTCSGCLTRDAS